MLPVAKIFNRSVPSKKNILLFKHGKVFNLTSKDKKLSFCVALLFTHSLACLKVIVDAGLLWLFFSVTKIIREAIRKVDRLFVQGKVNIP